MLLADFCLTDEAKRLEGSVKNLHRDSDNLSISADSVTGIHVVNHDLL